MRLAPAALEEWMRRYYFTTTHDIGSSGVENYSFAEVRALLGITTDELDAIVFQDSETLGGRGLRQAIAGHLAAGRVDSVMVTHGSTDANHLCMTSLLAAGDEVVVLDPCYQQLYGIAAAMGCTLKRWPLRFERGYRPDLDELDALLTPKVKMLVVNFPHNPTGASISRAEQQRLIAAVARIGAYLVWDGAFAEITYDEPPLPEPLQYPLALSMGTMSKAYGLPGLRVGWCLAAPEILEQLVRVRDYTTLHLSPLVEFVAQRVMENAALIVGRRLQQARANREIVAAWMSDQDGRLDWVPPRGGVSAFVRFVERIDVDAFCHRLASEAGVLLVPGSCFHASAHARLGFGCSAATLREGLARTASLLAVTPVRGEDATVPYPVVDDEPGRVPVGEDSQAIGGIGNAESCP
jgi:capreomycidine synthase